VKILVTGAAGFVGQHLCAELEAHGHEVVGSDRVDHDLAIPYRAEALVRKTKPDYVAHLAARYGRLLCHDEPHRAVTDNTAATTELAAACAERGIPVLYASSSEVYGDHRRAIIAEDSPLHTPTTIYGLSKRLGEEVLRLYLQPEKLLVVRCNMLYGVGQLGGYGRCSLATFIKNAVEGEPFTVHRGTTRSWLYITDAVRALRLLVEGAHHGTYNLGNPAPPVSMLDVAQAVVEEAGGLFEIADPPRNQIAHKNYDCRKLLRTIDWEPQVELRPGIRRTVEWAREEVPVAAA
jgi:nucleoside-diphosphate-sugar epimerase